ncbi:MAG: methylmalonyl Co-A mutase-associated GTPase MeaB [Deltaproteobacteria bacterium]|nr:methylmalonyl Co-A mutase-associated GTPase MeaB [Deltaproteobacteria bacterium]
MPEFTLEDYVNGVRTGDRRILAKAITLIESLRADDSRMARDLLDRIHPFTGNAARVGITGVPGAGKSTFIDAFGLHLTSKGHKVAVLAVDPSSSVSGGSILGDKTRMERLTLDPNAFIRPSPSGGALGGVARKTRETMMLCEAAGFDVILVETVGVGQSETAVASMVDFFLVLMIAGAGDELQGIKKGIIELADGLVVNKADGDNRERALKARAEYENALHLLQPSNDSWAPHVLAASAIEGTGIPEVWEMILQYRKLMTETGGLTTKRRQQALDWMWNVIDDGLQRRFREDSMIAPLAAAAERQVLAGERSPTAAAIDLLEKFHPSAKKT